MESWKLWIVRMARENSGWGYDRMLSALANLGYTVSDQTASNILRRHGIAPAPRRSRTMSWKDFLAAHRRRAGRSGFLHGGEFWKWRGLVTCYVLFFIHLETRRITIAGITRHPDGEWMGQIARRATQESWGYLSGCRYVLHDRDKKFCASFRSVLTAAGVKTDPAPGKEAESERICRALGPISETGVPFKTGSVGRRSVAA